MVTCHNPPLPISRKHTLRVAATGEASEELLAFCQCSAINGAPWIPFGNGH
jgi:hypothetical protein